VSLGCPYSVDADGNESCYAFPIYNLICETMIPRSRFHSLRNPNPLILFVNDDWRGEALIPQTPNPSFTYVVRQRENVFSLEWVLSFLLLYARLANLENGWLGMNGVYRRHKSHSRSYVIQLNPCNVLVVIFVFYISSRLLVIRPSDAGDPATWKLRIGILLSPRTVQNL